MKKGRVILIGALLLFMLAACSNEQDEIIGIYEDFSNLMETGEEEFGKVEMLISEYTMETISEEDFEAEKATLDGYFDELKKDLDAIDKPGSDRGQEYYELSYKVVDEMIVFSKEMLILPDLEDYDAIIEYQENLVEGIGSLEMAIEDLSDMHDELEEEDDAYKEAFKEE